MREALLIVITLLALATAWHAGYTMGLTEGERRGPRRGPCR